MTRPMSEYFANDPECHDLLPCALRSYRVAGLGGCPTGPPVDGVTSTSIPALWPCTFCSDRPQSCGVSELLCGPFAMFLGSFAVFRSSFVVLRGPLRSFCDVCGVLCGVSEFLCGPLRCLVLPVHSHLSN